MAAEQNKSLISTGNVESLIHFVRGQKVMFAADLARIYGVTAARLNQQFNRNRNRFPDDFAFQVSKEELESLMLQTATSKPGRKENARQYRVRAPKIK